MTVCRNCNKELDDNCSFCVNCGAPVIKKSDIVIDGKKNKRFNSLINKVYSSGTLNIIFSVIFALIFVLVTFILIDSLDSLIQKSDEISKVISQLSFKYGYVLEGMDISYMAGEIEFLVLYGLDILMSVISVILLAASVYYIIFNCFLLHHRRKHKECLYVQKPVAFIRLNILITKIITVIIISLLLLLVILSGIAFFAF